MGTTTKDDELTVRGANPRTGVISPWVVHEDSEDSSYMDSYLGVCRALLAAPRPRHVSSSRWEQDEQGWSLVESPIPILMVALGERDYAGSRKVSLQKNAEDIAAVRVSRVDDRDREALQEIDEDIKAGRTSSARQRRSRETLSQTVPKIRRKEVGGSPRARETTFNVIDDEQKGTLSWSKQQVRMTTPNSKIQTGCSRKGHSQVPVPNLRPQQLPSALPSPGLMQPSSSMSENSNWAADREALHPSIYDSVRVGEKESNHNNRQELKHHSKPERSAHRYPSLYSILATNFNDDIPVVRLLRQSNLTGLPGSYRRPVNLQPAHVRADRKGEFTQSSPGVPRSQRLAPPPRA